jgi:hypothetical protein
MSNQKLKVSLAASLVLATLGLGGCVDPQQNRMTFFVTSVGSGKGADLGGLAGADQHCWNLAQAVGAGSRTWRAYLSTASTSAAPGVNAIDRIGRGP